MNVAMFLHKMHQLAALCILTECKQRSASVATAMLRRLAMIIYDPLRRQTPVLQMASCNKEWQIRSKLHVAADQPGVAYLYTCLVDLMHFAPVANSQAQLQVRSTCWH